MNGWLRISLITILSVFLSVSGMVSAGIRAAGAEEIEGDVITIDNDGYKKDREGPVKFSHRNHAKEYGVSCWDCHHEYKDGQNVWSPWGEIQACQDCHDAQKKQGEVPNLQKAYHVNCKGCHKSMVKKGQKSGPYKKCAACHEKKK